MSDAAGSRRQFLKRTLRASAYVPPALVAMSIRNVAVAQATPPGGGMKCGNPKPPTPPPCP